MAFKISLDLQKHLLNGGIISAIAGTSGTAGTATLNLYSGTQPANADAGTSGTLICTIAGISWNTATNGTTGLASTDGYSGTAIKAGTIGWGRMECISEKGTCRIDGNAGSNGGEVWSTTRCIVGAGDAVHLVTADLFVVG